jgi:hypothetical protein
MNTTDNKTPQPTKWDILGACLLGCLMSITWYLSYLSGIGAL